MMRGFLELFSASGEGRDAGGIYATRLKSLGVAEITLAEWSSESTPPTAITEHQWVVSMNLGRYNSHVLNELQHVRIIA